MKEHGNRTAWWPHAHAQKLRDVMYLGLRDSRLQGRTTTPSPPPSEPGRRGNRYPSTRSRRLPTVQRGRSKVNFREPAGRALIRANCFLITPISRAPADGNVNPFSTLGKSSSRSAIHAHQSEGTEFGRPSPEPSS